MSVVYRYSSGDLLGERNTYFYSSFGGIAFLGAWLKKGQISCVGLLP